MRQQDYKMVQGGNTRVNMSAGAASQAGNAMAKLGQTLAQTGQDVSKIMEATVDAQERTDLIRAKQKWKEIQAKQNIFQDKNKRDPLLWDENRQKLMKEFDAYNNGIKTYTKNGSLNLQLAREAWASDFEYGTLQGMQKRINMNLAGETMASVQDSLDNDDPLGAQRALDNGKGALTPEAESQYQRQINKGQERLIYNDSIDMIDVDPKGEYEKIKNHKGHYAHYKKDRDTTEKLLAESRSRQSLRAREQADNLLARVNSSTKFTPTDLDEMIENGELDQYSDGNLAKLKASVMRDKPMTNAEKTNAYRMIVDLEKRRSSMTAEEYVEEYNNLEASVMSVMPAKGEGWIRQYLRSINPASRDTGSTTSKNKSRAKKEVTKVLVSSLEMGQFATDYKPDSKQYEDGEFKEEPLSVQEAARVKMADDEAELHDWIDSHEGEISLPDLRLKINEVMGNRKVTSAQAIIPKPSQQQVTTNRNLYRKRRIANELDTEEIRGYNELPQRQGVTSGSLLPKGKKGMDEFVQKMTQQEIDDLREFLNEQ